MGHKDDKYGEEEENLTQVRSIIKHLNEEKPAQERAREVVVRADGSKVVRVTKKRRVMMSSADVRRRNRKHILYLLAGCLVLLMAGGAYLLFRMSTIVAVSVILAVICPAVLQGHNRADFEFEFKHPVELVVEVVLGAACGSVVTVSFFRQ